MHEKKITVYSFLVLFYATIALLGLITIQNGIYYETFGYYSLSRLNFIPYMFAFITYFVLLAPFYKIKCNFSKLDFIFTKQTKHFMVIWSIIYISFSILKLAEAMIAISLGLATTYEMRHNDGISLFQYDPVLSKFNGYASFFQDATVPFVMLYALIGMTKKYVSKKFAVFLMLLSFLPSVFEGIGMGSRGNLFMTFFCFLFFVFLLYDVLPKRFILRISQLGIFFIVLVLVYSWLITVDRLGDSSSGFDSVLRYFGEAFPNLGFTVWDHATYHPMGKRFFPEVYGLKVATFSVNDAYHFWWSKTNVPVLNFKTYYGDLYVEFGKIGGLIFVLLTSLPIYMYFRKTRINVYNISYLYFYYQLCVFAFSGFTKTGWHSIFQLLIITIFSLYLKHLYRKKR